MVAVYYNAWQLGEVQEFERQKLNSDSGTNSLYFAKLPVICRPSLYVVKINLVKRNSFRILEYKLAVMKRFTKKQKEEILDAIDLRLDTISDDAESATAFESKESLNELKAKIETGSMAFTHGEVEWIKEEMEWKLEMHYAAAETEIGFAAQGNINSLQNSIDKL